MARVPVIELDGVLIATVLDDIHDRDALRLQEDLSELLVRTGARGVLLDLTTVETVDSFLGRMVNDIAQVSRLLGAHTLVAGIQPAVAITLVELGLELRGVRTVLNPRKGMERLRRLIGDEIRRGR